MVLVRTFGVVLLITVALSGLAARSVLSTALVFLVAGALVGPGILGLIEVSPEGPLVSRLADSMAATSTPPTWTTAPCRSSTPSR